VAAAVAARAEDLVKRYGRMAGILPSGVGSGHRRDRRGRPGPAAQQSTYRGHRAAQEVRVGRGAGRDTVHGAAGAG